MSNDNNKAAVVFTTKDGRHVKGSHFEVRVTDETGEHFAEMTRAEFGRWVRRQVSFAVSSGAWQE